MAQSRGSRDEQLTPDRGEHPLEGATAKPAGARGRRSGVLHSLGVPAPTIYGSLAGILLEIRAADGFPQPVPPRTEVSARCIVGAGLTRLFMIGAWQN